MIPNITTISTNFEEKTQTSVTYEMHIEDDYINGFIDGREAMKQAIYKILNTERYQYIIYSWDYGIELMDLFGKQTPYVCVEVKRRIKEALLQDDRISRLENFSFDVQKKNEVKVTFTAITIFGEFEITQEVDY